MKAEIAERIRLINKGQVPEGYKRETSYLYNTDWKFTTVSEVMEIRNNLRLPISEEERKNIQGIYPYYGPTKIQGYIDRFTVEGEHVLIGEDGDHFLKYKEKEMTLLIDGKFNVNNHAHILRGTDLCTTKWFYYYFQNRDIFSSLTRQGAGRYKLTKDALIKMKMVVPPLPEQQKIASILSTWDKAIELKEKLISEKKKQKTALMQELLTGKKRLDDFDGEWEKMKLGEASIIKKGKALSSKNIKEGHYPVIAGGKTSPYSHNEFTDENVITVSASGAYAGYVSFYKMKIWASDCTVIKEKPNKTIIDFLFFFMTYKQDDVYVLQTGGAQPHIYPKDLENIYISLPSIPEQTAIANILSLADKEISLLEKELQALKEQKKGLMQLLLTGIVRVN